MRQSVVAGSRWSWIESKVWRSAIVPKPSPADARAAAAPVPRRWPLSPALEEKPLALSEDEAETERRRVMVPSE
jgi:hypothetical protein